MVCFPHPFPHHLLARQRVWQETANYFFCKGQIGEEQELRICANTMNSHSSVTGISGYTLSIPSTQELLVFQVIPQ